MAWISTTLTLAAIVVVALQGLSFFSRAQGPKASSTLPPVGAGSKPIVDWLLPDGTAAPYARLGGAMDLLLAAGGLIAFLLFKAGAVIASPEYSVLLVQGPVAQVCTWLLLVGASLTAGLIWQTARVAKGLHTRLGWISILGTAVGVAAVLRIQAVNPVDPTAFCIRFYDMWWAPLLIWIIICISQWLATTLGVRAWARMMWALFSVSGSALIPTHRALQGLQFGDPWSQPIWRIVLLCGIPLCTAAAVAELLKHSKRTRAVVSVLAGFVGLAAAAWWTKVHLPGIFHGWDVYTARFHLPWILQPWLLWMASATVLVVDGIRGKSFARPLNHRGLPAHIAALVGVVLIVLSLADITHFIFLDPAWDLAVLILAWTVLLEVMAESPLAALVGWMTEQTQATATWLRRLSASKPKAPEGSQDTAAGKGTPKLSMLVKLIIALATLTAIAEIPNARKIIVRPFSTLAISERLQKDSEGKQQADSKDLAGYKKEVGQAISDRVANALALVGEEMRPDLLTAAHSDSTLKRFWIPTTSLDTDGVRTDVKSTGLEIPGTSITIPVEFVTQPVQKPVRWLLDVQEIQGTMQPDGQKYILLATSSTGQTWRIRAELKESGSGQTWSVPDAVLPADDCPKVDGSGTNETLNPADALAYMIVSSDDRLLKLGMASSWTAIPPFLEGVSAWRKFDQTNDYSYLSRSICEFRRATQADPTFALAHYRLGRALTADGQPAAAVAAFREGINANRNFVAGYIALANILNDFEEPYYLPGAEVLDQHGSAQTDDAACRNRKEAIELWRRVIQDLPNQSSVPDQAAAYIGLCHSIVAEAEPPDGYDPSACKESKDAKPSAQIDRHARYAAFFYCKRAEHLYSKLPDLLRDDEPVRNARASALTQIGEILDGTPFTKPDSPPQPEKVSWSCDLQDDAWLVRTRGPYTAFARSYYQQATAIQPDNLRARCSFAVDSLALHDPNPMQELEADNSIHRAVGNSWWALAGKAEASNKGDGAATIAAKSYYSKALKEFKRAVDLAPFDVRSKNDYAYTVWQWRVRHHLWSEPSPLNDADVKDMDRQAEEYAHQAVSLAQDRDVTTRMIMRSTLLETLLDRSLMARSAAPDIWEVLNRKKIPNHAYFDELRWDLAQAYLCLNSSAGGKSAGVELLKQIAANEAAREVRPYTDAKLLNPLCYLRQPGPAETVPQKESDVPRQTTEVPEPLPTTRVASK